MGTQTVQKSVSFAISLLVLVSVLTACGKEVPNTATGASQPASAINYCVFNGTSYLLHAAVPAKSNTSCSCEQRDSSAAPTVLCLQ